MVVHPLWRAYAPHANAGRQSQRIARRQREPGPLQESQPSWRAQYEFLRALIEAGIPDEVIRVVHVGSTAVPDLLAKPVIDIDLTVPDVLDEARYLPRLEAVGFRLIFRDELAGDAHRQLTFAEPNANLHVWDAGAVEPARHALFVARLNSDEADRHRYAEAKRAAATGSSRYNDLKSAAVYDIYERAFLADPAHAHDPQPREVAPA